MSDLIGNPDALLDKACEAEVKWLESKDDSLRKRANLYFKKAAQADGAPDYSGDVI